MVPCTGTNIVALTMLQVAMGPMTMAKATTLAMVFKLLMAVNLARPFFHLQDHSWNNIRKTTTTTVLAVEGDRMPMEEQHLKVTMHGCLKRGRVLLVEPVVL